MLFPIKSNKIPFKEHRQHCGCWESQGFLGLRDYTIPERYASNQETCLGTQFLCAYCI